MRYTLLAIAAVLQLACPAASQYGSSQYTNAGPSASSKPEPAYPIRSGFSKNEADVFPEGNPVNDLGIDRTSKACRYDDGAGWSDCDPFELVRYKVLRLVAGGSQCEGIKNITKHCTPHEFPHGTHWLIQEHRKCVAELTRLKSMIAELSKFIQVMHQKGRELYSAYSKLKDKLGELTIRLDKLKVEGAHAQDVLQKLKDDIEGWKTKARDLQVQVDEIKAKYHDLQNEEKQINLANDQLISDINIIEKENEGLTKRIQLMKVQNEELKRKILETEHMKSEIMDRKHEKIKLSNSLEKLDDKLVNLKDKLNECKIARIGKMHKLYKDLETKDTHVDLSMEMYITHNKTRYKPEMPPLFFRMEKDYKKAADSPKCLISYYGATNETCWYETEGERSEDPYVSALGHHLVEAHWKYFTIDVKDQYECDRAAHLHYEFLLNRCEPKHYLPVLSVYRPNSEATELNTHIYPKAHVAPGMTCWITFLGAHGHCEKHNTEFPLFNTADHETNRDACLKKAQWWFDYCQTPVIVTYVPDEVSTNWQLHWIMHDSHGGRMFEDMVDTSNKINPDSLKPYAAKPSLYKSQYKSAGAKSLDYFDSPEYRKSLHLQGKEKEEMLQILRKKLGGRAGQKGQDVQNFVGQREEPKPTTEAPSLSAAETYAAADSYAAPQYPEPTTTTTEAYYEASTTTTEQAYVEPATSNYEEPSTYAPAPTEPSYPTPAPYEPKESAEEVPYEEPKYEEPATQAPYVAPQSVDEYKK